MLEIRVLHLEGGGKASLALEERNRVKEDDAKLHNNGLNATLPPVEHVLGVRACSLEGDG